VPLTEVAIVFTDLFDGWSAPASGCPPPTGSDARAVNDLDRLFLGLHLFAGLAPASGSVLFRPPGPSHGARKATAQAAMETWPQRSLVLMGFGAAGFRGLGALRSSAAYGLLFDSSAGVACC